LDLTASGGDSGSVLSNVLPPAHQNSDREENLCQIAGLLPGSIEIHKGLRKDGETQVTKIAHITNDIISIVELALIKKPMTAQID
jgi:hypothetical protein